MVAENKYLEDITNNERFNFIGFATTPWHALGLMASVYKIMESGEKLFGTIYITPHSQTGYSIDHSFFPSIEGIKVERIQKSESIRDRFLKILYSLYYLLRNGNSNKRSRQIYVVEPWCINSSLSGLLVKKIKDINLIHVVYDEGVSTYFSLKFNNSNIPTFIYNQFLKHIVFGKGFKYLSSKSNFVSAKLFAETNNGLVENRTIIPYYFKALSESPKRLHQTIEFGDNSVVICTTAWDRLEIKEDEDVEIIKTVERLLEDMGYKVWFKPHPRDKNFKKLYPNVDILDNRISIEGILLNCTKKPKAMISISSTILVTSKLFFGVKSVDLSKILNAANIGKYVNEVSSFQKVFGNYVLEPEKIEDLRALI